MMKKILLSVLVVSVVWGFGVGVCVAEKPELKLPLRVLFGALPTSA